MGAADIIGGAPVWVYVLLAILILLGIRRLKTREVPIAVALIPVIAFCVWSILGAHSFSALAGTKIALGAWFGGAVIGAGSAYILAEAQAIRLPAGRVRLPGSWMPLILYMMVFIARFACGAWAAIVPENSITASTIGIAISAAMTARLAMSVFQWRKASDAELMGPDLRL